MDSTGFGVIIFVIALVWGAMAALSSLPAVGGEFYAAYSLSFIVPVLAEALNPADTDLWQLLSCNEPRPSLCSVALAVGHTGLNSVDRVFFALGASDPASCPAKVAPLLEVMSAKVVTLLTWSACLRWRLARALGLPALATNAEMLERVDSTEQPEPPPPAEEVATATLVLIGS